MAHGRQEFPLVGYSEYLEKRPLKFVEPIPASRICSACGNIPRLTYMLLCGHTFCEPCYQSCVTTSECVCPLDDDVCAAKDVSSKEYPAENLLRRKVHCWNEASGCHVVLPASQVAEHVRHDCQYQVLLNRDVCAHLKSRCTELVLHAVPEAQHAADNSEKTQLVVFERKVEQRVRELDAKLSQLSLESASQSDKLIEICHNINYLKEAQTQQFGQASVQTLDRLDRKEADLKSLVAHEKTIEQRVGELDAKLAQLPLETANKLIELSQNNNNLKEALTEQFGQVSDRNAAEMKALYCEKSESLMNAISSAFASVPSDPKTHQRVLTGYSALKEEALKVGWSWSMGDKVYLRRYLMSWGIYFEKEGDSVFLSLCIQFHEGREDECLDWPFTKEMKLSIIHPETRQERHLGGEGVSSGSAKKFYSRPIQDSNAPTSFDYSRVASSDIERAGYVNTDQLLLRFEVLL